MALQKNYRLPAVKELTGLSTSTIYDMIAKRQFPKPVKIGARAVAWPEADLIKWQADRAVQSGKAA